MAFGTDGNHIPISGIRLKTATAKNQFLQ